MKETCAQVRLALKHLPVWSRQQEGDPAHRIERYICSVDDCRLLPTPDPVVVVHFGGKLVSPDYDSPLQETRSFPGVTTIIPGHAETAWLFHGDSDFAVIVFGAEAGETLSRAVQTLAEPVNLQGPLCGNLTRQLIDVYTSQESGNEGLHSLDDYTAALARALLAQICYQVEHSDEQFSFDATATRFNYVQEAVKYIQSHLGNALTAEELAGHVGLHASYFRQIFKQVVGLSPRQYILKIRLEKAGELLSSTDLPIVQIAARTGFNSQSHMTSTFRRQLLITPSMYRKRQQTASAEVT